MAKLVKPLTDTEIKQSKIRDKEYTLFDGNNLILSIRPSGKKVWLYTYKKPYTKKRSKITVGEYPSITLAQARKKRDEFNELLANDIDPVDHKLDVQRKFAADSENTLKAVSEKWLEVKKSSVSDDHAKDTWRSLELHIFPDMGNFPISKITAQNTIKVIKPISARGHLETVKRLCQRLNEIMYYAVNVGLIDINPIAKINAAFSAPEKTHMPTILPKELPALMKAIARASINFTTRRMIEWQLHTMTRPSETAGARWDEIDVENKIWTIPADRMKKKREHKIPLTPQTLEILDELKAMWCNSDYLFPSSRNLNKPCNSQTTNTALKRMGYAGKLVSHGLRALASTTLNEQGHDADIIEAALSHVSDNEVRRAYNHAEYLERRRVMMNWWSDHIEQAAHTNLVSEIKVCA